MNTTDLQIVLGDVTIPGWRCPSFEARAPVDTLVLGTGDGIVISVLSSLSISSFKGAEDLSPRQSPWPTEPALPVASFPKRKALGEVSLTSNCWAVVKNSLARG